MGIRFSHHSVPSLSKTAIRSSVGTAAGPPSVVTDRTKPRMARLVAPSRQLGSGSPAAPAGCPWGGPAGGAAGAGSIMAVPRLLAGEHRGCFAFEVDVGFAAHVDGDPFQGSAGERPGGGAGVVVGDRFPGAPADG